MYPEINSCWEVTLGWNDLGLIFRVNQLTDWAVSHCYVPTAVELDDRIRVFCAFWDNCNRGRLGYIDLNKQQPTEILGFSAQPVMSDASPNSFDSDGVTPLSIVKHEHELRLYYAGWKRFDDPNRRYTLYTGLAFSENNGLSFRRYSNEPIMKPRSRDELIRTGGFVLQRGDKWQTWLATSYGVSYTGEKAIPKYKLETMVSADGIKWPSKQKVVFDFVEGSILGYGRSAVWSELDGYQGMFSVRSWDSRYHGIYHATSKDGLTWSPLSLNGMGFSVGDTCDNQVEVSFPSIISQKNRYLMFYNGNDFGKEGLRLAIWNK